MSQILGIPDKFLNDLNQLNKVKAAIVICTLLKIK